MPTEAETAFSQARQDVLVLVPYPTPQRVAELAQDVVPKLADLFTQQGVFDQMPEAVDPQRVILAIATIYGSVHDYRALDRLVIAASPTRIYPIFVKDSGRSFDEELNGIELRSISVAIKMKHGGITEEDRPDVEDTIMSEVITDLWLREVKYVSPEDAMDYFQRVPVYPEQGWKNIFELSTGVEDFVSRFVLRDVQNIRYIGELVPQRVS